MRRPLVRAFASVWLIICCLAASGGYTGLRAAPVVVPAGLAPGDSYRLAFVTNGVRDALSNDIADYNAFVTLAANAVPELAALGTIWRAIGSTSGVDARDNTNTNPFVDGTGSPIYSLDGVDLIAADNQDLWDGIIVSAIRETENGVIENSTGIAWTGSWFDGTGFAGGLLGDPNAVIGFTPFFHSQAWVATEARPSSDEYHLYAISGVLIAPAVAIPELPTILIFTFGLIGLWCIRVKRRPDLA